MAYSSKLSINAVHFLMFQIRDEMYAEVTNLSSQIDEKKEGLLKKIDQLVNVAQTLKMVQHHTS